MLHGPLCKNSRLMVGKTCSGGALGRFIKKRSRACGLKSLYFCASAKLAWFDDLCAKIKTVNLKKKPKGQKLAQLS